MMIKEIINKAKNILIVGHINPDGDCLGAGLGFLRVCTKLNKRAFLVYDSPIPKQYAFMDGFELINPLFDEQKPEKFDTVFALDCADKARLGKYSEQFFAAAVSVNIDHHVSNTMFAKTNVVEGEASSTCEMLARFFIRENLMDSTVAGLLFAGLSTDTGHFGHSNTNAEVFRLAAELCDFGANPHEIVSKLYRSNTVQRTKLVAKAIESMRFFEDDSVCVMAITADMLKSVDCLITSTENLIDYAVGVGSVKACACITESAKDTYKVSFRSKDKSILSAAQVFGGGGHRFAAGCLVRGKLEDVVDKVKKAIVDAMQA